MTRSFPETGLPLWLAPLIAALLWGGFADAGPPRGYQVKAVLLFNLARYTEWPEARETRDGFPICVFGEDPFQGSLELAVRGEKLDGEPVGIRFLRTPEQIAGCRILFVASTSPQQESEILRNAAAHPVLTVDQVLGRERRW